MATTSQFDHALIEDLVRFLDDYYREDLAQLAQHYPQEQSSLTIDFMDLWSFDQDIADDLQAHPREFIDALEEAVGAYDLPVAVDLSEVTVRVAGLPSEERYQVGGYRSDDIGRYIGVEGQVSKLTAVKPKPTKLVYECQRCGSHTEVPQATDGIQEPHQCSGCDRQGPFKIDQERSEFIDYQCARLKRPPEETKGGSSTSVDVMLDGDVVGTLNAGDRVTVGGIMSIEDPTDGDVAFDPYIDGRAVELEQTDYSQIDVDEHLEDIRAYANGTHGDPYELLIDSIAPKIQGLAQIKEAVVLQMFGGIRVEYPDGTHDRGDPHILLLGDPGTAKSTLLEQAEQKAPRATYASGKGATAAGLTAAATKDDFGEGQFSLEAGALVLADKGIACVDEIDKVDGAAVESMHEALSKQKIHVNKGGINARLPARTALLAAGNPTHGRFDDHEPIAQQIDLGPTMLSRFDLLFMIQDEPDKERDATIVEGMIESRSKGILYTDESKPVGEDALEGIEPAVETDVFRAWIAFAKQNIYPKWDDEEAAERMKVNFAQLRQANGDDPDNPVPVTMRSLEGIQRLAEASARVRLSETVEMQDVERAQRLVGRSMRDVGIDPETGQLDADIVETGTSDSQRDRIHSLKDIIDDLASENPKGAPKEEVLEAALDRDMGKNQTKHELAQLKKKGEIYEPEQGYYRGT